MTKRFISGRLLFACELASIGLVVLTCAASLAADLAAEELRVPSGTPPTRSTRQLVWKVVAAELLARGITDEKLPRSDDLDLPGALQPLDGHKLRVTAACWDARPQRMQFRIECGEPGQCLPFLVYLSHDHLSHDRKHDSPSDPKRNSKRKPNGPGDTHNDATIVSDADAPAELCQPAAGTSQAANYLAEPEVPPKPTVHPGDAATAIFLTENLRMTASVTCLDRGREGEVIRVRSQNGQIFRARISGPGVLEALPQ